MNEGHSQHFGYPEDEPEHSVDSESGERREFPLNKWLLCGKLVRWHVFAEGWASLEYDHEIQRQSLSSPLSINVCLFSKLNFLKEAADQIEDNSESSYA